MLVKFLGLIAVISVATCLVPAGTHFFELANKMSMSQPEYMIVQKIYAGWSFFGIAVIAALLLTLIHTFMVRSDRTAFFLSLAAFLCLAATQGIFWMFTYPMNVASNNWTHVPSAREAYAIPNARTASVASPWMRSHAACLLRPRAVDCEKNGKLVNLCEAAVRRLQGSVSTNPRDIRGLHAGSRAVVARRSVSRCD